jgi:hypothetical protein
MAEFDFLTGGAPPAAPAATGPGPSDAGFDFLTDTRALLPSGGEYARRSAQAGLSVERPWEEQSQILQARGIDPEGQRQGYELARLKRQELERPVGVGEQYLRKYVPFVSAVRGARAQGRYGEAVERFNAGQATDDDLKEIARFEDLQAYDARGAKSFGGELAHALAGLPTIAAEFMAGGAAVGRLGRAVGIGRAAAAAPRATIPLAAARNPTVAARFATHAGRMAALTPAVPSMYLEDAAARNREAGRGILDPRGLAPALGHAYATMLVLGSLQKVGNTVPTLAGRLGAKGAIGVGEMAAADVALGAVDEFLPEAYKTHTRYGIIGNIVRGETEHALRRGAIEMLTFAAFAGMHEATDGRPGERKLPSARRVVESFDALTDSLARKGGGAEKTAKYLESLHDRLKKAMAENPELTRGQARALFGHLEGPAAEYAKAITERLPEAGPRATGEAREVADPRQARPSAETPQSPGGGLGQWELTPAEYHTNSPERVGEMVYARAIAAGRTPAEAQQLATQALIRSMREQAAGKRGGVRKPDTQPEAPGTPTSPAAAPAGQTTPQGPVGPPAAGKSLLARVPDYKGTGSNVDAAIKELIGPFAGKWFSRGLAQNEGYHGKDKVQIVFDEARIGGEADVVENRVKEVGLGSKTPMYLHPALDAVRWKGKAEGEAFERLRDLIEDANAERKAAGLEPVRLEATEKPSAETPQSDPAADVDALLRAEARRRAETEALKRAADAPKPGLADVFEEVMREYTPPPEPADPRRMRVVGDVLRSDPADMPEMFHRPMTYREAKRLANLGRERKGMDAETKDERIGEQLYANTPYESLPKNVRADMDPLVEWMSRQTGQSPEFLRDIVRAAYLARGRSGAGPRGWLELRKLWREKKAEIEAQDAELQQFLKEARNEAEDATEWTQEQHLEFIAGQKRRFAERTGQTGEAQRPVAEGPGGEGQGLRQEGGVEGTGEPAAVGELMAAGRVLSLIELFEKSGGDPGKAIEVLRADPELAGRAGLELPEASDAPKAPATPSDPVEVQKIVKNRARKLSRDEVVALAKKAGLSDAEIKKNSKETLAGIVASRLGVEALGGKTAAKKVAEKRAKAEPAAEPEAPAEKPSLVSEVPEGEGTGGAEATAEGSILGASNTGEGSLEASVRRQAEAKKAKQKERADKARAKKAPALKIAEGDWAAEEEARGAAGAVTMAQEIRSRGYLSEKSIEAAGQDLKALKQGPLKSVIRKDGKLALDEMAEELANKGLIERSDSEHVTETLLRAIEEHRLVESGDWDAVAEERRMRQELWDETEARVKDERSDWKMVHPKAKGEADAVRIETAKRMEKMMSAARPEAEGSDDIPFSPKPGQGSRATAETPQSRGPAPTPFQVIETARKLFAVPDYTEGQVPGGARDRAAYLTEAGATVTGRLAAGDVTTGLHEIAHHLTEAYKLETNPARLPAEVKRGLAEFDYEPERAMGRLKMREGFAEWFSLRQQGRLENLTADQQKASEWAESFLARNGLTGKADRVKEMFGRVRSADPVAAARGLVSGTAAEAGPELTPAERAGVTADTAGQRFQDEVIDDLGVLKRMEAFYEQRSGKKLGAGEKASIEVFGLLGSERAVAGEWEKGGVWTVRDGKRVQVGESLDKILEGVRPEEMLPGEAGEAGEFGTFAVARHVLGEFARAEEAGRRVKELEKVLATTAEAKQRAALERDIARLKKKAEFQIVSTEQRAAYEKAMAQWQKDPNKFARFDAAAKRLTQAFLATQRALESPDVHFFRPGTADALDQARPDYVPTDRVLSGGRTKRPGAGRGEAPRKLLFERSGSGEAIVDPVISYQKRLAINAAVLVKQLKTNAVMKLAELPEMGEFLAFGEKVPTEEARRIQEQALDVFDMSGVEVEELFRQLQEERGISLFTHEPWPADGSKPTVWWNGPGGELTNVRVRDRALYELLTDRQVDAHQTARLAAGLANFTVFGVRPFWAVASAVRKGATALSLGFQVRNVFPTRDPAAFLSNTIDRASAKDLPGTYRQLYAYYWNRLVQGMGFEGKKQDRLLEQFVKERGEELRKFNEFMPGRPQTAYAKARAAQASRGVRNLRSAWEFAKDLMALAGAGELAPRFLEWKNRLKQVTGKTEAELRAAFEAADRAHAEGKPYADPIPLALLHEGGVAAAEVTVPFNRQGTVTRQLNKVHPFFGPAVSGLAKAVRNWRENPKGAMIALGGLLSLRMMHWLAFSDEEWYRELSAHDRFNNFVVPTPLGLRRIPGPRDIPAVGGAALVTVLDAAAGNRPDFKGALAESFDAVRPPLPLTPGVALAWDLGTNENWMGVPIVPRRDEGLPAAEKAGRYQIPYAAEQLAGGRLPTSARGLGLVPFTEVSQPRRSVDEFYERLQEMRAEARSAKRAGRPVENEAEWKRFERAENELADLRRRARGERLVGGKVVKGSPPDAAELRRLRQREVEVAKKALGL